MGEVGADTGVGTAWEVCGGDERTHPYFNPPRSHLGQSNHQNHIERGAHTYLHSQRTGARYMAIATGSEGESKYNGQSRHYLP